MATASEGHTSFASGVGSSSGQFRGYTKFPDATKSTNGALQRTDKMTQDPRPSSGQNMERTPSIAAARVSAQDHNRSNASPGLGARELVELASTNALIEGVLGPNKDGRVRNPVPSKLKGKTDNKQGNFGVMHMGLSPGKKSESHGRDAAAERDAAARKTSEATASRAKAAQSDKYVPPKKRGLEATLNDISSRANRGSPFAVPREDRQRSRPLAPDETKMEQARLLTLLRTINPITVVDQICKAVAYFGGIPGAPPPEDGIFPESANTRETGALFIGWLAEIFPDLSPRSPEVSKDQIQTGGKKKGRPSKGSKITIGNENLGSSEPPNSRNGYGYGPAVSAPAWGLPPSLAVVNPEGPAVPIPLPNSSTAGDLGIGHNQKSAQSPSTPIQPQVDDSGKDSTNKRRRGRPKGSRNKGRSDGQPGSENDTTNNMQNDGQDHGAAPTSHGVEAKNGTSENVQAHQKPQTAFPAVNSQANMSKPNQSLQYPQQPWIDTSAQNMIAQVSVLPMGDELSPEERAVLEAFRHQGPEALNVVPSPGVSAKPAPEAGQKRKRAPPKPKVAAPPVSNYSADQTSISKASPMMPQNQSVGTGKDPPQWAPAGPSVSAAPPPKRARQKKPKAATNSIDTSSRNQTASAVSIATPPIPPSTIPDSQASSSQQSIPVSRPPAEGLEAHYERFASLQQQQNGRSTPTQPQQQHVRQHSKPSSVPPQQNTPQMKQPQMQQPQMQQPQIQQQQMQQQKSQQSNQQQSVQREEPKLNQAPSTRPSSASFYNQRSQPSTAATYNQQYPSHQPSQIFTAHQPSPQMSNSSYRTSSTHAMAQASPQFSQAENSYRTASPHTNISQPSPSYSQNDNFRTNNAHNLAQPSPSFSQPDTTYRAPSTHSMAQPTPSYSTSRTHNQTQPSNQGHYGGFSDPSYIDLPTLESLGHSTTTGGYGQGLSVGNGPAARSSASSNSLYGSSGLGNAYDTSTNDILRGISRTANSSTAYGASSSGLNSAYDTTTNEHEMRERLLRGLGGRR